jgi:hypothetical protein
MTRSMGPVRVRAVTKGTLMKQNHEFRSRSGTKTARIRGMGPGWYLNEYRDPIRGILFKT